MFHQYNHNVNHGMEKNAQRFILDKAIEHQRKIKCFNRKLFVKKWAEFKLVSFRVFFSIFMFVFFSFIATSLFSDESNTHDLNSSNLKIVNK